MGVNDPRAIHVAEQSIASFRSTAASLAAMYGELRKDGVPPDHARDLTVAYVAALLAMPVPPKKP